MNLDCVKRYPYHGGKKEKEGNENNGVEIRRVKSFETCQSFRHLQFGAMTTHAQIFAGHKLSFLLASHRRVKKMEHMVHVCLN